MAKRNYWLDEAIRDRGTYRYLIDTKSDDLLLSERQMCNRHDEMEDALIAALDAGLTPEEIADIQLGATS